ncbi:hypothetical protein C0J52_10000 [Blattella germanica]|nr:hypothetical protein C0J52_10000 [Blattella germanica]
MHTQKGHECKATQRVTGPVRLRFGPCRSRKRYRPKFCGSCPRLCCKPQLSTTIKVEFHCDIGEAVENERDLLLDLTEPGIDLWTPDPPPEEDQENEEDHRYYYYHHQSHHQGARWPPWRREGIEFQELRETKRMFRTVFLSVQWILKCHCADSCVGDVQDMLATARPTNGDGEVILHRVHRTAAP